MRSVGVILCSLILFASSAAYGQKDNVEITVVAFFDGPPAPMESRAFDNIL